MSSTTAAQPQADCSTTISASNPAATTSARCQRRLQLRELNLAAWAETSHEADNQARLDTSLKRHTTLLTRLRSSIHTTATVPAILKEIASLSLDKYVEEAVGATFEGLAKCKTGPETWAAIEVVSALHQRFPHTFTPPLVSLILASLAPSTSSSATDREVREKEDTQRITKQRGLLRLLGELEVVGIVGKGSSTGADKTLSVNSGMVGELTWKILKEWLTSDKEQLSLVAPLAIALAKHLGPLYLPPPPTAAASTADDGAASAPAVDSHEFPALSSSKDDAETSSLVPREMKDKFRKLLLAYLDALGRKEGRNHLELQKQDKRNHEAYIRSGEVFEDREKIYERNVKNWERGWSSVTQLSEILGVAAPILPSLASTLTASSIVGTGTSSFQQGEEIGGPGSIWIDEEDKNFYEDLRELKGAVPGKFLGLGSKEEDAAVAEEEQEKDEHKMDVDKATTDEQEIIEADETPPAEHGVKAGPAAETEVDAPLAAGPAAQLTALLTRLVDASSRSSIDDIAIEFAFLNSKAARKRLVKHLASVNRNRQDLLPYYARLVGTLNTYMPDIGKELITILEEEFRYLQRKRQVDLAETRSKNLKFLSELTKFKVTPIHSILHVFKVLLDDFSGANIDNFCTVLEGCGRFLLRSEATSERMRLVLETYKRKKAAMHLDQRQITMLENAYYQCDPPDRPAIPPKERTPMQLYIRHLIYHQMSRNNVDKIAKLIRKLHWEDPAIVAKLHSAFTKVAKIKFSNIHLFAVLLDELVKFHSDFVVGVIDEVMENIRLGMEVNSFKYNQQRIATIKYLGEMYNYRVIESRVIFDTLWSLITFGHRKWQSTDFQRGSYVLIRKLRAITAQGHAHPAAPIPIDMPDDSFRIRLICVLLDTCGECFDRGQLRKKLDTFLIFFQSYVLTKRGIPMDVGFMVDDLFEKLRPKAARFANWEEAEKVASELRTQAGNRANGTTGGAGKGGQIEGAIVEEEEEEDEERPRIEVDSDTGKKSGDDSSGSDDGSEGESEDDEGDTSDHDDDDDDSNENTVEEDEDVEGAARPKDPNAMTEEEENEFSRDLAKMMAGTGGSAGGGVEVRNKPALFDVGVPFVRKTAPRGGRIDDDEETDGEDLRPKGMRFTLLTKKGNKQQTRSMEIPLESSIAVHTLEKRALDKAEQQQLKKLVLDYEQREEVAEKQAFKDEMARRGINLKFKVVP
ncbi:BQ2448_7504 [Microbotryum intermedium]|uniref:BQ2448_7504 protein n=1 Tax=Microbotryum intermedium TaxID=269621 RepID=A0A238FQV2_9BASI|nr:BQ2448_7504 [Microbotryum intermedium]